MDIEGLYTKAKNKVEKTSGTYRLFQIAPEIEEFCLDEFLRLIEQDCRTPRYRDDILGLPRWQQQCSYICMAEFLEQLAKLKAERLSAR